MSRRLLPALAAGALLVALAVGWFVRGAGGEAGAAESAAESASSSASNSASDGADVRASGQVGVATAPATDTGAFTGFAGSVVRFASVAEARAVLGADDVWLRATGALQRAALMGVPTAGAAATSDAFRAFQADAALPWTPEQRQRFTRALEAVAPQFNRLGITLPPQVLLVSTSGRESDDTPHTRGNAIMFPVGHDPRPFSDVELMAHELWHVVSRHAPALRTRLYAALGFSPAAPLEWPAAWAQLRDANPDAPHHEHLMWVTLRARPVALMPVVLRVADAAPGNGIVAPPVSTRLLEVIPGSGGQPTRAVLHRGVPVWHAPESVPEYLKNLGGNSDYIVHPEETLADNVMFLVSGRTVPNPDLLRRIAGLLAAR